MQAQSYEKDDSVNKGVPRAYAPVTQELTDAIDFNLWRDIFQETINTAQTHNIPGITSIRTVDKYLSYLNSLLRWLPSEDLTGRDIVYHLLILYFVLNQPLTLRRPDPHLPLFDPQAPFLALHLADPLRPSHEILP